MISRIDSETVPGTVSKRYRAFFFPVSDKVLAEVVVNHDEEEPFNSRLLILTMWKTWQKILSQIDIT